VQICNMKKGNTNKVMPAELQKLYITQPLSIHSLNKRFTRHLTNCCLYLPPNEYVLLNWLIYYSDGINVVIYSTELLKQFDAASDRAIEIYGKDKIQYSVRLVNVRESFVKLVEKGMLIKLSKKNNYMVNPMMVYTHNNRIFNENNCQKAYMAILESADGDANKIKEGLTKYCDKLQSIFEKELRRTNI